MSAFGLSELIDRYIAAWNEPERGRRDSEARQLWAPDGAVINSREEYRGHEALQQAISRSYERFIAQGYRYRARPGSSSHHDAVCVLWEMLDPSAAATSFGANFLLLDSERRIRLDYQFVER